VTAVQLDRDDAQALVTDLFGGYFRDRSTSAQVRAAAEAGGVDLALWGGLQELGGDRVALADSGGTMVDASLIGIEAGRYVAPVPYSQSAAGLRLAERLGLGGHLPATATVCVLRLPELAAREPAEAAAADHLLIVGADTARLHRCPAQVPVDNLGKVGLCVPALAESAAPLAEAAVTRQAIESWRADLRTLDAALLVGAALRALEMTVEHVQARQQFGRPIGSFQALQHRLADLSTSCRAAELLVYRAASYGDGTGARRYYAAVALSAASTAAVAATRDGLQLFGGYGYSLEYDMHLYLRYAMARSVLSRDARLELDCQPAHAWPEHPAGGPCAS
jgi:3-oxochol-4-en-24-oyl-CoA dehydrogenase